MSQGALEMHATAALNDGLGRHLAVGWILDLHTFIGTGELALMFAGSTFRSFVGGSQNGVVLGIIFLVGSRRGVGEWADEC